VPRSAQTAGEPAHELPQGRIRGRHHGPLDAPGRYDHRRRELSIPHAHEQLRAGSAQSSEDVELSGWEVLPIRNPNCAVFEGMNRCVRCDRALIESACLPDLRVVTANGGC